MAGRTTGVLLPGGDKDALRWSPYQAALILLLKARACVMCVCVDVPGAGVLEELRAEAA